MHYTDCVISLATFQVAISYKMGPDKNFQELKMNSGYFEMVLPVLDNGCLDVYD